MFSQWRHAVENLTQHSPKSSQDSLTEEGATRGSTDSSHIRSLPSSSLLADSALSNLRKSLATQRPASPVAKTSPPNNTAENSARARTTLEDRLRAKFTVGEASEGTTPSQSSRPSPATTPVPPFEDPLSNTPPVSETHAAHSNEPRALLSPRSTPLPDSPPILPSIAAPVPMSAITSQPLSPPAEDDAVEATTSTIDQPNETSQEDAVDQLDDADQGGSKSSDALPADIAEDIAVAQPIEPGQDIAVQMPIVEVSVHPAEGSDEPHAAIDETQLSVDKTIATTSSSDTQSAVEVGTVIGSSSSEEVASILEASPLQHDPFPENSGDAPDIHGNVPPNGQTEHPKNDEVDIEALQNRLKLVEQRFADVSTSFKRLQAEKVAADRVLRELTTVESIQEPDALRDYIQNINLKTEMAQDEIKRLTGKLTRQDERIEELRDIHRLESKSQSEQIHKLQAQVNEAEALLKAGQASAQHAEELSAKRQGEIDKLTVDLEKMKSVAKDEEEKRVKAISLLKTVRQKLVKAEKDRDDAQKETQTLRESAQAERENERAERQRLHDEVEKVNAERETAVKGLKAQFDREISALKERQEKELGALRGQYELEVITLKSLNTKELEIKTAKISDLEASLQLLTREKDELFDQLQMRQAELESSQSHLESLQSQSTELQYQLREATDRIALLNDEVAEAHKSQLLKPHGSTPTVEVTQLLSAAEAKYEARVSDLRRQLAAAERERDDTEADLNRKLGEKVKEVEQLKGVVGLSAKAREDEEETIANLRKEINGLQAASLAYERLVTELQSQAGRATEIETQAQIQIAEVKSAMAAVAQQLEESKSREAQARTLNKTLRDELRKVQSSAALLERQRNPGVGYWASKTESSAELRSPVSSAPDLPRESPRPETPSSAKSEEEVNFEYLRNIILQFLEHKEMRPHLVRILSTILRFTPQETRRLVAKV